MIESEPREYKKAVISYIDILAFKEMVGRSATSPERVGEIAALLQAVRNDLGFNPKIKRSRDETKASNFFSENFSDLTIRTRFLSGEFSYSAATQEIGYLATTQFNLAATENVLIRGGVCLGQILADGDVTFGPGLVKAYLLESEFAVYPRIVVDRDLATKLLGEAEDQLASRLLRRGEDGAYFIDYLFSQTHQCFWMDEWRDGCSLLGQHREFVMRRLGDRVQDQPERVKQKLIWLALYHNSVIHRLAEDEHSRSSELRTADLRIDDAALAF